MIISKRLKYISSLVNDVEKIVDVGTDHGYVVIELLNKDKIKSAIASDINKGPVERARDNVKAYGLSQKVSCRLGSGLKTVKPGEVDAAVIAGMGGNLIKDIIEADMDVFKKLKYAILQPVQNPEVVREYILTKGFNLEDEWIVYDEDKYYEIMKVSYGKNITKTDLVDIDYEVSDILIRKKDPVYFDYLKYKIKRYEYVLDNLKDDTENARNRKNELRTKLEKLKSIIKFKI